jgi:hypothetical protein
MGKWETIDVCDALELLSPVFESEEVITQSREIYWKTVLVVFYLYSVN